MRAFFHLFCQTALGLLWAAAAATVAAQPAHAQPPAPAAATGAATDAPAACPASFAPVDSAAPLGADPAAQATALQQQLATLDPLATACDDRADYHAQRGALLLALQRPAEAAIALEKSLLLAPDQPGTQLDYAQALAQSGQRSAARDLLRSVLARPDLPAGLRERLAPGAQEPAQPEAGTATAQAGWWDALLRTPWRWRGQLQASAGRETNLNNATASDSLTLVLPGGVVTLPLADTERPVGGPGFKTLALLQAERPVDALAPGGELRLGLNLSDKQSPALGSAATSLLDATVAYAHPVPGGALALGLNQQALWMGGQAAYTSQGVQLRWEPQATWAGCQWAPQLGHALQSYPGNPVLDGYQTYVRADAICPAGPSARNLLGISRAVDTALDATRPGGTRQRQELLLRHERLLGQGQLNLWARWHHSEDSTAYSPLLGDLRNSIRTTWLGLGYWWPAGARWSMGVDVESTSQNSNNSLYQMENFSIYGGVRLLLN